jgi:hypothetical protein
MAMSTQPLAVLLAWLVDDVLWSAASAISPAPIVSSAAPAKYASTRPRGCFADSSRISVSSAGGYSDALSASGRAVGSALITPT